MNLLDFFTGGAALPILPTQLQNNAIVATAHQQIAEPPKPTEKIEQVETEIIAWRGWRMAEVEDSGEPVLRSYNGTQWDGPTLAADKTPAIGSEHGIYALKKFPDASSFNYTGYFVEAAFGQVALSGLVVEGENGYRAERATIRSLWVADLESLPLRDRYCVWELAGMLEQRYAVEVDVAGKRWRGWRKDLEVAIHRRRLNAMSRF